MFKHFTTVVEAEAEVEVEAEAVRLEMKALEFLPLPH
jgi:hypothetical protein